MVSMTILALCASLSCYSNALPFIVFDTLPAQPTPSFLSSIVDSAPVAPTPLATPTSSTAMSASSSSSAATNSTVELDPVLPTAPLVITTTITTPIIEVTNVEDTTTATQTVTSIITLLLPPPTPVPPPDPSSSSSASWSAPTQMSDLTSFNITSIGGKKNLELVDGIPAGASATSFAAESTPTGISINDSPWNNDSSVLQLLYPAHSINPGNKERPQGGAQFYASPVDLSDANNVTMNFDVFFPVDFDFVKGGKLPGLYGGHKGCSGGAEADDCFSTRLMWREDGVGELYLYAPKDKQTEALCSDAGSVCDTTYGFSLGRGCFSYKPGEWTTLTQTVALNTPGKQDGHFTLDVNGERVISRTDIYFRNRVAPEVEDPEPEPDPAPNSDSGLLGGILGGILRLKRSYHTQWKVVLGASGLDRGVLMAAEEKMAQKTVGFIGMFFSSFFGGHEDDWETPIDQYAWFKGFALSINS